MAGCGSGISSRASSHLIEQVDEKESCGHQGISLLAQLLLLGAMAGIIMGRDGWLREFIIELLPHAIWSLVLWLGLLVGAAMIWSLIALVQKIRHISFDWFLLGGVFVVSFFVFAGLLYLVKRIGTASDLSTLRPKIAPVRWGRASNNRYGLIVRNDGEPAFDISVEEPVLVGNSKLQFWDRIHAGLTKVDGEMLMEARIELSPGYALAASGLREQMIKAGLDVITLKVKYGDIDGQKWVTSCDVVREFWGDGIRISGIKQERVA